FRFLLKAQELAPDDSEVRLKLGAIYLLGEKPVKAREEAVSVLAKEPNNVDALALLADTSTTPEQVDAAIKRIEEALPTVSDRAKPHLALGTLYLRKQDQDRAERAFQEAVAREPKSVEAHFLLGSLYLVKRDSAQAEREFKTAADLAPIGSPARLRLVDFYV